MLLFSIAGRLTLKYEAHLTPWDATAFSQVLLVAKPTGSPQWLRELRASQHCDRTSCKKEGAPLDGESPFIIFYWFP